jgi:phage-related protein
MALATFTWSPQIKPTGDNTFRVRTAQFGDGYSQVAGDGINTETQSWDLSFTGDTDYISPIVAFLRAQAGTSSFIWTPPLGVPGLYRCAEFKPTPLGGGNYTLTATFTQSFQP